MFNKAKISKRIWNHTNAELNQHTHVTTSAVVWIQHLLY